MAGLASAFAIFRASALVAKKQCGLELTAIERAEFPELARGYEPRQIGCPPPLLKTEANNDG